MPMTDAISSIVMASGSTQDIEIQAREEGILSMRQSGLRKVASGITTMEEVGRVTTD